MGGGVEGKQLRSRKLALSESSIKEEKTCLNSSTGGQMPGEREVQLFNSRGGRGRKERKEGGDQGRNSGEEESHFTGTATEESQTHIWDEIGIKKKRKWEGNTFRFNEEKTTKARGGLKEPLPEFALSNSEV